jgi:DNA-binding MarR family transcriptional regulator
MVVKFHPEGNYSLIRQTHDSIVKVEEAAFQKAGLTLQQFMVMDSIVRVQKPVTVTDVAVFLDRQLNSISLIIDRMVRAGLVKRVRSKKDQRLVTLMLTSKGQANYTEGLKVSKQLVGLIISGIRAGELRAMNNVLNKVHDNTLNLRGVKALNAAEVMEEIAG